ncbi:hypothetical protein J2T17_003462 [Paenibacillus mucilaginosus]
MNGKGSGRQHERTIPTGESIEFNRIEIQGETRRRS